MLVIPRADLPAGLGAKVMSSIRRLRLNDDDTCVQARFQYIRDFAAGDISLPYLRRNAPFIAAELDSQGLVHSITTLIA
jgi:hypothetical protein